MIGLGAKLWAGLAAIGGVLAGIAAIWAKGRSDGRNSVIIAQVKKDEAVREQFQAIDRQSPDVDASVSRLRQRAARSGVPDPKQPAD